MTKLILKGLCASFVAVVFAALSAPVEAAQVECKIPFDFTVNGRTLPQGRYYVSSTVEGTLFIRGWSKGAITLTNVVKSDEPSDAKLVFHKYGDQYILRQVWMGGSSGRELPQPRLERTLARGAQEGKVARGFEVVVTPVL